MADAERLSDDDIRAIVQAELRQAIGSTGSDLSQQRAEAMKRYLGEAYGNEQPGRSSVISTDIMDTVEWIMPSLLRIFTSGDQTGRFEPTKPGDEESAKQATEYVNWIWNSQNNGFTNTYVWLKDAIIQKVGVVKIWCEQGETWEREAYDDLPEAAFAELAGDPDIEIVEHTEKTAAEMIGGDALEIPNPEALNEIKLYDLVVKRRKEHKRFMVEPVPPEEFLISKEAKGVQSARLCAHRTRRTLSDLREEGYSDELLAQIGGGSENATFGEEALTRDTLSDEQAATANPILDDSMREVWVDECYIRADRNGDGIAEMLQVTMAGNVVLKIEDWEGLRPFAAWTPIIMPHRFFGLSISDLIADLQLIKTTLLRQFLDGLYIAINPRTEVKADQIVDPAEVLDSRPGGLVRSTGQGPALIPIQTAFVGDAALQGMNYIDQLRENRTGVSPRVQGLGSNSLHDTASGEQMLLSKAQEKVELIARVFAETGLRDAFKLMLSLICQHQDQATAIRLRGKWVQMDPRAWANDFDYEVTVGIGHGSRDMLAVQLQRMLGLQMQAIQMQGGLNGPMVTGPNIYATVSRWVEAIGLKSAEPYFTDPSQAPPQQRPPKPDPKMMEAQAKAKLEQEKAQADAMLKQQQAQQDMALQAEKMRHQVALDREKAVADAQLAREKAALEFELARQRADLEAQLSRENAMRQAAVSPVRPGGVVG